MLLVFARATKMFDTARVGDASIFRCIHAAHGTFFVRKQHCRPPLSPTRQLFRDMRHRPSAHGCCYRDKLPFEVSNAQQFSSGRCLLIPDITLTSLFAGQPKIAEEVLRH